jgi:hypothetical protein
MLKKNHKEVESTIISVGSTSKPIRAMDACWQWGHACMILRQLCRGYGCSLAVKQCREKRDEEHTSVYKQSEMLLCGVSFF